MKVLEVESDSTFVKVLVTLASSPRDSKIAVSAFPNHCY